MIEAVFISDLHLHPHEEQITNRFNQFMDWALQHTKSVYILGDLFHAWPGDDGLDDWSRKIAGRLKELSAKQIALYYIHGNRDFLLGEQFARLAGMKILSEPAIIQLGNESIMLAHGDRYCTKDVSHQWLRRLTRNKIFPRIFLKLPFKIRTKLVQAVRQHSENGQKPMKKLHTVSSAMIRHMQHYKVSMLIHGHTHKPGLTLHEHAGTFFRQYVLSDWDDTPVLMCYDSSNSFYFDPKLE
jgi:UDP-2,3-diacylglucosamine hydrolase